jgi:hypothetical protein
MLRQFWVSIAWVLGAGAASAVSLTVSPDKLTYTVGETVTLTVIGDPEGAKDDAILGVLDYSAALTSTVSASQTQHTYTVGSSTLFATTGTLVLGDGFATVFNQIINDSFPRVVNEIQVATATLIADAVGVVSVSWDTTGPDQLQFFGVANAPGTSFTIVPEPSAMALVAVGVLALAAWRRRSA